MGVTGQVAPRPLARSEVPPRHWPWAVAAGVILAAWVVGYFAWGRPYAPEEFESFNDWFIPALILACGLPAFIVAAYLLSRSSRMLRVLGSAAVVVGVAGVSFLIQLNHFGGFCLDPGDVCMVAWPSRILGLLTSLGALSVGLLVRTRLASSRR